MTAWRIGGRVAFGIGGRCWGTATVLDAMPLPKPKWCRLQMPHREIEMTYHGAGRWRQHGSKLDMQLVPLPGGEQGT